MGEGIMEVERGLLDEEQMMGEERVIHGAGQQADTPWYS